MLGHGWSNPDSPKLFADYCAWAASELAGDIDAAFTINEPNVYAIVAWMPNDENQLSCSRRLPP
jgi:beta-glucosidase